MPPLVLESRERRSAYSAGKQTFIFTRTVKQPHVLGYIHVAWSACSSLGQCFSTYLPHVPLAWEKEFTPGQPDMACIKEMLSPLLQFNVFGCSD
jgi:hypothetical protein